MPSPRLGTLRFVGQLDPRWRVVAGFLPATDLPIDARDLQATSDRRAKQQMINPQTGVPAKGVSEVIPKCVDPLAGMELAQGVGPTLSYEARVGFADFRTEQGVVEPALRFVDVEIGGHDVVVAGKDDRRTCRKQVGRMRREALEPAQLVVEFRAGRGVAVRQVETAYQDPMHRRPM